MRVAAAGGGARLRALLRARRDSASRTMAGPGPAATAGIIVIGDEILKVRRGTGSGGGGDRGGVLLV